MKVEAIFARDSNNVIGVGDDLPWRHSGDLRRFKKITDGNALLIGAKTFLGIARSFYAGSGKQVLPGRILYVIGTPRNPIDETAHGEFRSIHKRGYGSDWVQLVHELVTEMNSIGVDRNNVRVILDDGDARQILDRIETTFPDTHKLLIAGGAKVYDKFIEQAEVVHSTDISPDVSAGAEIVKLTPKTVNHLKNYPHVYYEGDETVDGVTAHYVTYRAFQ